MTLSEIKTGTTFHIHIDIKQFLKKPDKELRNMLRTEDGHTLTPDEVREFFIAELREGHDYWSPCDNRKEDGSCAGHPHE